MIQLFPDKSECCGCGACAAICPKNAIDMLPDEGGYIYPTVDPTKCVECGACLNVCNFKPNTACAPLMIYAAQRTSPKIERSASGGIFAALAEAVIAEGGVAFGCALQRTEDGLIPTIVAARTQEELLPLLGSKYVQSSTADTYIEVRRLLRSGKRVLYSGLPCQIAGLKGFLHKDDPNLITMDVICHGTPNAEMFRGFVRSIERRKGRITNLNFRSKKAGWGKFYYQFDYTDKKGLRKPCTRDFRHSEYYRMFLAGSIYRESCFSCPFASAHRVSDLTIGDCWGIEKELPQGDKANGGNMEFRKGMSCILINTEQGRSFFEQHRALFVMQPIAFEAVARYNQQLRAPIRKPACRDAYIRSFARGGYPALVHTYYRTEWRNLLKEQVSGLLPSNLKRGIKQILTHNKSLKSWKP